MPLRIVANGVRDPVGARHRGVLPRSRTGVPQPQAAADRRHHRPGKQRLRIAVCTKSITREASPEVRELTLKTAALLEELGHRVTEIDNPVPAGSWTTSCCTGRCWRSRWCAADGARSGRASTAAGWTTSPWAWNATRPATCTGCRWPSRGCRASRRITARLGATYDVLLTPTLAEVTPRIGHLDPTARLQQIIDRLIDWVAFTPLQNVTGEPAISLPLGAIRAGCRSG